MDELPLQTDFPDVSRDAWREGVEAGSRGVAFETLVRRTEDGLQRGPLMSAQDLPPELAHLARADVPLLEGRPWHIAAPVRDPDFAHANQQLLDDLKGGASAVRIENAQEMTDRSDLKRVLEGVETDLVPIVFRHGSLSGDKFETVLSVKSLHTAHLWAGLSPRGYGDLLASQLDSAPANWRLMGISGAAVHERGATEVQELMSVAAELALSLRRFGPEATQRHMVIELAAECDTHLTIAKFRAARRIVLRLLDAYGANGSDIPIIGITSLRMMQTQDAWTNLLRVMGAGFGAVVGGADMVVTRPFTDGLGHATPFAHRIARNMQLMMMEESRLGTPHDPAHGSYWHERMTEDLAQAAWRAFQRVEQAGGVERYMAQGLFDPLLEAATAAREARGEPILGVTLHPAEGVKAPEVRS